MPSPFAATAARISKLLPSSVVESILNFASNELQKGEEVINITQTYVVFHEKSMLAGATLAWLHATAQGCRCNSCKARFARRELCGDYGDECNHPYTVVFIDLRLHRIHLVLPYRQYVWHLIYRAMRNVKCRVCNTCRGRLFQPHSVVW